MSSTTKFLGTSDEVTTCDCCGRKDLKSTVALSIDEGEPVYYGVTCAARALKSDVKTVRSESRRADDEKYKAEQEAKRIAWEAEKAPWFAFLAANGTGGDTFRQIQSLGGFKIAHARYEAERSGSETTNAV